MKRTLAAAVLALLLLAACHPSPRFADPGPAGQDLVNQAAELVYRMRAESHAHALDIYFAEAQGVVIAPAIYRAGYFGAVDLGQAVLLARDQAGFYSEPVFLSVGGASFGLQIGAQRTAAVLFLMSPEAMDRAVQGTLTLGADARLTVLTWGEAHDRDMVSPFADVYAVLDPSGFYAGVTLSGAAFSLHQGLNQARYGQGVTARDVLFERCCYQVPGAERLQRVLSPFWLDAI
jgi:lipid-binding SYLF domain-containing protein